MTTPPAGPTDALRPAPHRATPADAGPERRGGAHAPRAPHATGWWLHATVTGLIALVWLVVGPSEGPFQNHVAELVGVESVWLLGSSVLVLTRAPRLERSFGGVAGALRWHRLAGLAGVALALLHPLLLVADPTVPATAEGSVLADLLVPLTLVAVVLAGWALMTPTSRVAAWRGPVGWLARRSYDRWRAVHGLLAVFLVVAMAHGAVDGTSLPDRPVLLALYAGVCAAGLWALAERMVVARLGLREVAGTVTAVERFGTRTVVLTVVPDRPVRHAAGQFLELGTPSSGERPHPFSITSAPGTPAVELAVRTAGAGTTRLVERVAVGERVRLGTPRGDLGSGATTTREVWLAGGIGVAPFVSCIRARRQTGSVGRVDLVWAARGFDDEPFVDELAAEAGRSGWLVLHLHDTRRSTLSAADVVAAGGGAIDAMSVVACGPPGMVTRLGDDLASAGLPRGRWRTEAFSYR